MHLYLGLEHSNAPFDDVINENELIIKVGLIGYFDESAQDLGKYLFAESSDK
jgi:hypothetical protein